MLKSSIFIDVPADKWSLLGGTWLKLAGVPAKTRKFCSAPLAALDGFNDLANSCPLYHSCFRNIIVALPADEFLFQMIEELKDEELIRKIGGRFRLSALIQKRLVALNEGTPSAIDYGRNSSTATRDRLNTTIQEILQDKIYLSEEGKKRVHYDEGVSMVLDTEFTEGF